MGQYLKVNNMAQIKIHNGDIMRMRRLLMLINFCLSRNSTKFIRTFMGQYLNGNNMTQIKIHNGGYNAHAQTSNAYNFCLS